MEERWVELRKGADYEAISKKHKISKYIARIIRNRDIVGDDEIDMYLNGSLADLHDGMLLKDMRTATDILVEKIQEKKRIRIIGDYDIDGVNATYILLEGFERLGAVVDADIPERIKDGYGLNINLIESAVEAGVDTIVTCDNGVTAHAEIAYAKEQGLTVIVTDHHEVDFEDIAGENGFVRQYIYPDADAIINPKQVDCGYPFKHLCGAAVAYKLIDCLFQVMGHDSEDVDDLIENVAFATVGDIMELDGENRIFVKQGLEMMKRTKNLGLAALIEECGVNVDRLNTGDLGFRIGPCINASGRLETARKSLNLLRMKTKAEAQKLAAEIAEINESRKELTDKGVKQAKKIVEQSLMDDRVLVVYMPTCHESLAGIIAGRLRDAYYKPAYVVTDGEKGAKGSGRSIPAYIMNEEMNKCRELFAHFGGHKVAAGFSLKDKDVEKFRRRMNQICTLTEEELTPEISIDMQLSFSSLSEELVEELQCLEPFGRGNPSAKFAERNLEIMNWQVLGANQNVLKLRLKDANGIEINAMFYNDIVEFENYIVGKYGNNAFLAIKRGRSANVKIAAVYHPNVNEFRGNRELQIVLDHYR